MRLLVLCLLLAACKEESEIVSCSLGAVSGVKSHKVKELLEPYFVEVSSAVPVINVEYEVLCFPLVISEDKNSVYENLLIKISVSRGENEKNTALYYQHYGYENWQYNDSVFDFIAQNALVLAQSFVTEV